MIKYVIISFEAGGRMSVFRKIREIHHRRNAKNLDQESNTVALVTVREESHRGNFVYPGIDTLAHIEVEGVRVGEVDYGINPLGDRLYINMIEIRSGFRFRGYALATLWRLWKMHQVPIIPLHQRGDSILFWAKARKRFAAAGGQLEQDLRVSEMDQAKQRWAHLVPELPYERKIREMQASPEWPQIKAELIKARHHSGSNK
ncbi:N-acetyltransferase [Pseudomonas sp. NPDC088368]|uniref:N-acetyltransferase n=1 Tax=Pseudomonas sp. NPDC088368 TaxID=3364453 RepID=UPI0038108564